VGNYEEIKENIMKTVTHIMLCIFLAATITGCLANAAQVKTIADEIMDVPDRDIIINGLFPPGFPEGVPVYVPKGYLNPSNDGSTWMKMDDFKKKMEDMKSREPAPESRGDTVKM
jgi:hypothetical protein